MLRVFLRQPFRELTMELMALELIEDSQRKAGV